MPRHLLHSDFRSDRRTAKKLKVQVLEIGYFAKIHPCEDATLRRMFCELLRMESEIRRFTPFTSELARYYITGTPCIGRLSKCRLPETQ